MLLFVGWLVGCKHSNGFSYVHFIQIENVEFVTFIYLFFAVQTFPVQVCSISENSFF